jgi:carbamoyl-phosphate synthase small subunit
MELKPAKLMLEDGTVYSGFAVGKGGTTQGEIAFNTGMTGYQEIFTDPSYYGQIMLLTPSHVGNYGVKLDEVESDKIMIEGLVCKKFSEVFSRPGGSSSLAEYFEAEGKVAICDVDTRSLVRHIRDKGAMNVVISSEVLEEDKLLEMVRKVPSMAGLELASKVSTKKAYDHNSTGEHKVAVLDYGAKKNILRCLEERDARLKVFPHNASSQDILAWEPDGIMLSNGPGDPSAMPEAVQTVRELIESNIPIFGICMEHQILSLALGLSTYKMHNGHRGVNHPILNLVTGKGEITSQNHGFVVDYKSAEEHPNVTVTHKHLNDETLAGIKLNDRPVFSVQYHPESSPGPNDARYLFDDFIKNITSVKATA